MEMFHLGAGAKSIKSGFCLILKHGVPVGLQEATPLSSEFGIRAGAGAKSLLGFRPQFYLLYFFFCTL